MLKNYLHKKLFYLMKLKNYKKIKKIESSFFISQRKKAQT